MHSHRMRAVFATCIIFAALVILLPFHRDRIYGWIVLSDNSRQLGNFDTEVHSNVEVVVASTRSEDTSWLKVYLPEWKTHIYVVDDPGSKLTVPKNKGRESMVYLTYIIDNYDDLADNIIFMHASRFAWHNDDPDYDAIPTLRNLQIPFIQESGYVNLRCVWAIGCPSEIRPVEDEQNRDETHPTTKDIYKQAFEALLPELRVPPVVAVSCCSQFAVSRQTVARRSKDDYIRYRQWLLDTALDDDRSGRVFEFTWHSKSLSRH